MSLFPTPPPPPTPFRCLGADYFSGNTAIVYCCQILPARASATPPLPPRPHTHIPPLRITNLMMWQFLSPCRKSASNPFSLSLLHFGFQRCLTCYGRVSASHLRNPYSIPGKRLAWESNTWQRGQGRRWWWRGGGDIYKKKKNLFKHTPSLCSLTHTDIFVISSIASDLNFYSTVAFSFSCLNSLLNFTES